MMMRPGDILGRIFYVVTEINHRIIGLSEFKRNLDGCCGIAYGKKSLGEIFNKIWPMARNHYGSTEDTEGTEFFLLLTQEILKEIFFKMLLRKKYIQLPGN